MRLFNEIWTYQGKRRQTNHILNTKQVHTIGEQINDRTKGRETTYYNMALVIMGTVT